jgi:hypothetical protein
MAGIFEISSIALTNSELKTFMGNAKKAEGFKEKKSKLDYLTITTNTLPVFTGYDIPTGNQTLAEIGFEHRFTNSAKVQDTFFDLLTIKDGLNSITCTFEVNDSGQEFDVEEEWDVQLGIGCDRFGFVFSCCIGRVCLGNKDHNYRKDLFEKLLRFTGCNDRLKFHFEEGELALRIEDGTIETPEFTFNEYRSKSNKLIRNSVRIGAGNLNGRNISSFSLYLFGEEEIRSFFDRIQNEYGPQIVGGRIYFALTQDKYDKVYALETVRNIAWKASFQAKPRYSLDDLDKALEENDSLLLSLFSLKSRKTGKVDVSICKGKGGIRLSFDAKMRKDSNKQEKAIHEMVNELAGGKDIIDHTPV